MGLVTRWRVWREKRRLREEVPPELCGVLEPPWTCAYWRGLGRDYVVGVDEDDIHRCKPHVCLAEIERQRDDRIERMIANPETYFTEARRRAEKWARDSVARDLR